MASPVLSVVSWAFSLLVTLIGILALTRGVISLVRRVREGTPEPGRMRPVGKRTWMLLTTALSHREFKGRPWVRLAHWFVMISFPLLFLTLITGYGQLRNQHFTLPLIGHFIPWEWLTEFFAWGGLFGIIALMIIRARSGRGSAAEAALSNDEPDQAAASLGARKGELPSDLSRPHPRDGSPKGTASRFLGSTRWQALFVEWVVLIVCACIITLRGLEFALESVTPGAALGVGLVWHFPLTSWIGSLLIGAGANATGIANGVVLVATLKIITSMLWMIVVGVQTSMGIAWHRFLAVINVYARRKADGSKSLGAADHMLINGKPVTSPDVFDDLDEDTVLGTSSLAELSWKARLDLYACTECGRCQELCPAWNTAKPLSPKLLIMSMRDHMESASKKEIVSQQISDAQVPGERSAKELAASGEIMLDKGVDPSPHSLDLLKVLAASGATGPMGVADVDAPLVPEVVSEEALWDCTMCGACVDQCPVDIEHIDHILDLRRHQVLMESAFPRELSRAFRGMESKQNPYNQPARKRLDWAKDLDFDVPVVGEDLEDASEVDYLFWVGCAGAFDDSAKKTSAAIAELLHTAGVSFAVLGSGESCTGDPARRAGNEVLFQMLAAQAIETLHEAKPQKIVVSCAHCFNTIAGEFPELGGHFEVVHHTQLLNRLVREGRLTPVAAPGAAKRSAAASVTANRGATTPVAAEPGEQGEALGTPLHVTYHDACYLGRHNKIFAPPRELLASLPGVELVEMPRHADRAMCCGAGGAHAWFEESRGTRIADARIAEAASTGADVVATACPFCSQMLGSASGASAGLFPVLAPASSASAGVGDSDSTGVAPGAGTGKSGGARVGASAGAGTSAGSSAGADASAATGADAGAQRIPLVKDVAIMLLESVRRGQEEHPGEGE
ncbi:(Fe-S)-binding protein [Schaalia cardiffensis]|uniref:(Fe-S)-binding protein n=1 Tax=Schaalia cardiffensis TaxID=181487 RepID=UPI0023F06C2D|nr:(Fe-S)-binding protein [Schaalia cardiffensis]